MTISVTFVGSGQEAHMETGFRVGQVFPDIVLPSLEDGRPTSMSVTYHHRADKGQLTLSRAGGSFLASKGELILASAAGRYRDSAPSNGIRRDIIELSLPTDRMNGLSNNAWQ